MDQCVEPCLSSLFYSGRRTEEREADVKRNEERARKGQKDNTIVGSER